MKITLIAAIAKNNVIGKEGKLPWHLPADLAFFKKMTLNKPVVMGRKSYQSLGKALPQRHNIIITRDKHFTANDADVVHSLDQALSLIDDDVPEVMITGGAEIYRLSLSVATDMWLTFIDRAFDGDTFFPDIQRRDWQMIHDEKYSPDDKNKYPHRYCHFVRVS